MLRKNNTYYDVIRPYLSSIASLSSVISLYSSSVKIKISCYNNCNSFVIKSVSIVDIAPHRRLTKNSKPSLSIIVNEKKQMCTRRYLSTL